MATYATAAELRTELDVNDTVLPDAKANRIIADASDLVDGVLGLWTPGDDGRKIQEDTVKAWQWTMLSRATVKAAANLYDNPDALTAQEWDVVKGPEFETSGARKSNVGLILNTVVIDLLCATLLIVRSGRAI